MKTKRSDLRLVGLLLGLVIIILWFPLAGSPTPLGGLVTCLPLGWWHFLQRNVSRIGLNWGLIATGLICSLLVVVVGNWLLRALFSQIRRASHAGQPPRQWRWRWTICLYCGIWLLFAIAFGAAGVLRHTTWLIESGQPWYQKRVNSYVELRMVDGLLQLLLLENHQDLELTRKAFGSQMSYRRSQDLMADEFNVIFYGNKSNQVAAYLIIPRTPRLVARGKFGASLPGTNGLVRPISELQPTIAELDASYTSSGL